MRFPLLKYLSLLLLLLVSAATVEAAEKRVLFIVETSRDTKALATAESKLISALIETGLGGLLEANDTLGVWTFDETLHVGKFPMQRWTPEGKKQVVQRTQDFLKMQSHVKAPRIETVWRPLQTVITNSPALMVVLITSGKQPIIGTPFDHEINHHLQNSRRDYEKRKTPSVIMLSATSGKILRYSVNPAIGDVRIPILTVPTNAAPVQIAQPAPKPKKSLPPQSAPIVSPVLPPKSDSDAALIITKAGTTTGSRLDADKITTDNVQSDAATPIAPVPHVDLATQYPELAKIDGPVVLNSKVEVVTHTIEIKPPTNAATEPEIAVKTEVLPQKQVAATDVTPPATATTPTQPIAPTPIPVRQAEPQALPTVLPNQPEPVKEVAVIKPAPVEVVQEVAAQVEVAKPQSASVPAQPQPVVTSLPNNPVSEETIEEVVTKPGAIAVPVEPQIQPQPLLAQTNPQPTGSLTFLVGALVLIFVAIILAFLVGRKMGTRPQQSLVSDWAERDRLKK